MISSTLISYDLEKNGSRIAIGQPAPDFTLQAPNGREFRLGFYLGQPVLVHFFTTWCGPCEAEIPVLKSYYKTYTPSLALLAVDEGDRSKSVENYIAEHALTFPVMLDPRLKVGRSFGITVYPTSVFINPRGEVAAIHIGTMESADFDYYLSQIGLLK